MAKKDKISKEVEEQIQSLASDVYIHIEEKLTQLICATTPKEASKKINVEQDPAYLALQSNYQASQKKLFEESKKFANKIKQLEEKNTHLKAQLADEQSKFAAKQVESQLSLKANDADSVKKFTQLEQEKNQLKQQLDDELAKQQANKQKFQVELTQNNINYTETLERLDFVEKQRKNNEEKSQKSAATWQKTDQLQKSTLIEQKKQITELNEQLKASASDSELTQEKYNSQIDNSKKEFEQKIAQMNKQLQQAQSESNEQKKTLTEQQQAQAVSQQQITQFEKKNQELADNLITEQSDIKLYQKEVESLKLQVKLAQEGQENVLNRFNANRDKQEKDNDQVRETIKYLRDENSEMISQYNNKKEQFLEQINELENKLTEYRLKFEYAQKQLTKNSEQ